MSYTDAHDASSSCSCASLRAKGHGAECSRCPSAVSPTRAAAEVRCEVMLRDDPNTNPAIYERGGYIALDSRGHYADRPGPSGKPHTLRRCAHIPEGFVGLCMQCRPSAQSSPAAMLGEALERARLVRKAFDMLPLEAKVVAVEAGAEHWRKAEAREGRTPASCWQCEAPLGTTEACLTCAAKRREDAQRTTPET